MLLRSDVTSKLTVVFDMIFEAEPIEIDNNNQKYIDKNNRLWPSNYNNKTITKHVEVGLNDKVKIRFVGEDYSLNDCKGLITDISYDPNKESPKNAKVLTVDCSGEFESRVYKILTDHIVDVVKLNDDWSDPEEVPIIEDPLDRQSSDPEIVEINKQKCFFANGTPIIIDTRKDGELGATIYWDNGVLEVDYNINIFSGRNNDTTLSNGDITINGGSVGNVYNGGYGNFHTSVSKITVNGGCVTSVSGGTNIVDELSNEYTTDISIIDINNGVVSSVSGVSEGTVKKSIININNGIHGDIIAGSLLDKGYVLDSTLNVSGEKTSIKFLEGLEKGIADFIEININGGYIYCLCSGQLPIFPDEETDTKEETITTEESDQMATNENTDIINDEQTTDSENEGGDSDKNTTIQLTNIFKYCILTIDKANSKIDTFTLGMNNNKYITEENNDCVTIIEK